MQCPICKLDLSPLDSVSKNEHVSLCLEYGPSRVDINSEGKPVIVKTIDAKKVRKICPVCDKTFQNLNSHFKTCVIKNDVPPDLMMDYWDKINNEDPKEFPTSLFNCFIEKCTKEGRNGYQVDVAKAFLLSMGGSEPSTTSNSKSNDLAETAAESIGVEVTSSTNNSQDPTNLLLQTNSRQVNAEHILMKNSNASTSRNNSKSAKKYMLETAQDSLKRANVQLMIERELSASRLRRYNEAVKNNINNCRDLIIEESHNYDHDDDDVVLIHDSQSTSKAVEEANSDEIDLNKLFHKARMKNCDASISCSKGECINHELELLLEEFKIYSGASMHSTPNKRMGTSEETIINEHEGLTSKDM